MKKEMKIIQAMGTADLERGTEPKEKRR